MKVAKTIDETFATPCRIRSKIVASEFAGIYVGIGILESDLSEAMYSPTGVYVNNGTVLIYEVRSQNCR